MGGYTFPGIKRERDGDYYYDDCDIPKVRLPVAETAEGMDISTTQLDEWFRFRVELPKVPKYYIQFRLKSKWNDDKDGWDITGDLVAYQPLKWVPMVYCADRVNKDERVITSDEDSVIVDETKLFASVSSAIEASGGSSFYGITIEAKVKVEASAQAERKTTHTKKVNWHTVAGDKPKKTIVLGMGLRVKRVFNRPIKLFNANKGGKHEIGWSGGPGWNDIFVSSGDLSRVEALQYSNVPMTAHGASDNIYFQVLPQFEGEELKELHLAISNVGWKDWYAYIPPGCEGNKTDGHPEIIPWRDYQPSSTQMAI